MGGPKALVELDGEPLVRRALRVLADGGCAPRVVVLGAAADAVRAVLPEDVTAAEAAEWAEGMGASLRTGMQALADSTDGAVLLSLVDLPDLVPEVVARVGRVARSPHVLARAAYEGVPGHPVLLGRDHWPGVLESAQGDQGARSYLSRHEVELVECGDLATGRDVNTRA